MSFAIPLGLLGLLGIAVLILIYLLKPNYQQKTVSSTFVWKLSMKYKRKTLPISKLRNILLIICQVMVITSCAMIFAQPFIVKDFANNHEKVIVIDASASMRAEVDGKKTRFERAVDEVKALVEETYKNADGKITVIMSTDQPYFLVQRAPVENKAEVLESLDGLVAEGSIACSYATGNVDRSFELAEQVVSANLNADVLYYTGTQQLPAQGKIHVVSVADENEWNVAILDAKAILRDNEYTFAIDVASYGRDSNLTVFCDVTVPGELEPVRLQYFGVSCTGEETKSIVINPTEHNENPEVSRVITQFETVRVYVNAAEDSFYYDNEFYIYGGVAPELKIQYASGMSNPFMTGILSSLREATRQRWQIEIDECRRSQTGKWNKEPANNGYDIYIYENVVPEEALPTDGVVFLFNPPVAPESSSFVVGREVHGDFTLAAGDEPTLLAGVTPGNITVSRYRKIEAYDGYTAIMNIEEDPAVLVRNTPDEKVMIFTFSVNYSLPITHDFPWFVYNAFNYFMPSTVTNSEGLTDFSFDVNEKVVLNSRSDKLSVSGPLWTGVQELVEFPEVLVLSMPGTYTASQLLLSNKMGEEKFFVKIASIESNITRIADELPVIVDEKQDFMQNLDLILYFAIALVALSAIEWFLHSKEHA